MLFPTQHNITRDNQIAILPILAKQYDISFDFYPTSFVAGYHSVLHMTISGDTDVYGCRVPGIWLSPNTITVDNAVNGHWYYRVVSSSFQRNEWHNMRLTQTLEDGQYVYRVYLNGIKIHQIVNTQAEEFNNVKVFVSNPWVAAQPGYIRDLHIHHNSKKL